MQKRYEYLAVENGKVVKKWTDFFECHFGEEKKKYQYGHKLLNEYRE